MMPAAAAPRAEMLTRLGMQSLQVHAVAAAVELKLADHIGTSVRTLEELAAQTGSSAPALRRLLRALASIGVFLETEDGYRNTPLSETLRADRPDSLAGWARFMASGEMNRCFEKLSVSVEDEAPVFDRIFGAPFFDYLNGNADHSRIFSAAMTSYSFSMVDEALTAYDFAGARMVVDIGGGHGAFLRSILSHHSETKGILFERPQVLEEFRALGLADEPRITLTAGDFFQPIAASGDIFLLRHILHDWADEEAVRILTNIRNAMPPDGRILIFEHILRGPNEADFAKFLDLVMLTFLTGRERDEAEFAALLSHARLRCRRIVPTAGPHSIIEAVPA